MQENDKKIVNEIKRRGKPYFFARTKIDNAVQDFADENPDTFSLEKWHETEVELRNTCKERLGDQEIDIFLTSRLDMKKVELEDEESILVAFPDNQRLKKSILESLPVIQKTALLFSTGPDSEEIIEMKVEELRGRFWRLAMISAAGGAVPVPFLSGFIDLKMFEDERAFQKRQLGIDPVSLQKKANLLQNIKQDLIDLVVKKSSDNATMRNLYRIMLNTDGISVTNAGQGTDLPLTIGRIMSSGAIFGATEVVENAMKFIPFVGPVIAGAISGSTTYGLLNASLSFNRTLALSCLEILKAHFSA